MNAYDYLHEYDGAQESLADDEVLLMNLADGTFHAIARTNKVGGVCDDCTPDWIKQEVVWVAKGKVLLDKIIFPKPRPRTSRKEK